MASPCIGICTLDDDLVCVGCQRTADEITRWMVMSDAEREQVMSRIEGVGAA